MEQLNYQETAQFIREDLRLKTFPLAVKFLKDKADLPEKTRQPSVVLGKRITICPKQVNSNNCSQGSIHQKQVLRYQEMRRPLL